MPASAPKHPGPDPAALSATLDNTSDLLQVTQLVHPSTIADYLLNDFAILPQGTRLVCALIPLIVWTAAFLWCIHEGLLEEKKVLRAGIVSSRESPQSQSELSDGKVSCHFLTQTQHLELCRLLSTTSYNWPKHD